MKLCNNAAVPKLVWFTAPFLNKGFFQDVLLQVKATQRYTDENSKMV